MKKKIVKKKKAPQKINHVIRTEYLEALYKKEFLKKLPLAVKKIKAIQKKTPFDAIAFTGVSGMGYGFPLSFFLKIPVIHVRKPANNHYNEPIEGTISSRRYLIVDDFIETGKTVKRIINIIKRELGKKAKPVGIFLYASDRLISFEDLPVYTIPK